MGGKVKVAEARMFWTPIIFVREAATKITSRKN